MARHSSVRHGRTRRFAALGTLVFVGVGMLALEHTATGASTGRPSHVTTTTARHNEKHDNRHDDKHDKKDDKHGDGGHHQTTTTRRVTTTTQRVTTTTSRHCDDGHGRDKKKHKHCRPPSGGHDDHHGDDHDKNHDKNRDNRNHR